MTDVSIVGIGTAGFSRIAECGITAMVDRAVRGAVADAGLERGNLDGLFVHVGSPRGMDYDSIARLLAIEVTFAAQTWAHGRFMASVQMHAALALRDGLVRYALCVGAFKNSAYTRHGTPGFPDFAEALRDGGGPHAEVPAAGLVGPVGGAALSTARYLHVFGHDPAKLAAVPVAQREWARRNPAAVMRNVMTVEDYAGSPPLVEPLRLLDCSVPIDTAVAVILTTDDRAADCRQPPVRLLAWQGLKAGVNEFVFGEPGLGINQRDSGDVPIFGADEPVFRRAHATPDDVGAFYCYDGFSPQVLWTLERFGYCGVGEALDFVQFGSVGPGGRLPTNTSGGHLSEGHSNGWGHTLELVRQLRGAAGPRQIKDIRVAQWATTCGDSIIYGR